MIAGLPFLHNHLVLLGLLDGHGPHDDFLVLAVQVLKKDGTIHICFHELLLLLAEIVDLGELQFCPVVVLSEDLLRTTYFAMDCMFLLGGLGDGKILDLVLVFLLDIGLDDLPGPVLLVFVMMSQPNDGVVERVGRSLLDEFCDQWLDKGVDMVDDIGMNVLVYPFHH